MNDVIEQPQPNTEQAPLEQPEAPVSIADHAAQFSPAAQKAADAEAPAGETAAEKTERLHHSAQQRREKTGEFREGKVRHRAQSQQARPEDVPRIRELTGKLRAAEDEVARLRTQHAPPAQIARAEQRVEQAQPKASASGFAEPEPQEDDPKFAGDYGKYLRAASAWEGRKAYADAKQGEQQAAERTKLEESHKATIKTWGERVNVAKEKYDNFEEVAFSQTNIPAGSLLDAWIVEHPAGADVLYYVQSHPQERDEILQMPVLQQAERLSLLSQRFSSSPLKQAGNTGSAAGRTQTIVLPHRPPNPVRTEAQRASDSPPPTDGSLSIAEHRKAFGPGRR